MLSTPTTRLPELSGKACAQHVSNVWAAVVYKNGFAHMLLGQPKTLGTNPTSMSSLYTKCIRFITSQISNFTSVIYELYTLYTGPIKTTTTYINRRIV